MSEDASPGPKLHERLVAALPAAVRPVVEKVIASAKGASRATKIMIATTALAFVLALAWFGVRAGEPRWVVLFANLDHEDAASVVAKLKEMKVPYRLEGDGSIVEVPEPRARELRLELAGAGLPRGGGVGFESFDKMRLGATEFEQRIMYRRALEGELARTIATVAAVQTARVHLVLPERSVFVSKNEPSSASVVLKLRSGRALGAGEVSSIVHLVSSSVAGLSPDRVAVVTTEGTVLHRPKRAGEDGNGAADDDRASQARTLEATLEERARAMVERVTGPGRVDVRVSADIDFTRIERVEDRFDPSKAALRSEARNVERNGDDIPVAGVPGAESNLPSGAARSAAALMDGGAPATQGAAGVTTRESHTRNYEIDHVTEKRVIAGGTLRRLTVAVVIDGSQGPTAKEDLEKIASLVRSAVGFDERRGDVVTVEAVPFLNGEQPAPPAPPPSFAATLASIASNRSARYAAAAAGALVLGLVVLARLRRSRSIASAALARAAAQEALAQEKASAKAVTIEVLGEEPKATAPSAEELRRLVRERAALDPATAAMIVRGWLGQREERASAEQEEAA
jgi:flagellar M-ring protein FliF